MSNDNHKAVTHVTVRAGSTPGTYDFTYEPARNVVKKKNTEMIYQLTSDTPAGILFTGMSSPSSDMGPGTVAAGGRSISFNNANSKKETVKVKLDFEDTVSFYSMPEVINEPQPSPP